MTPRHIFIHPLSKLGIAAAITALVLFLTWNISMNSMTRIILGWDTFGLIDIIFSWIVIMNCSAATVKRVAALEDIGHLVVFTILIIASLASLVGILYGINAEQENHLPKAAVLWIYVLAVVISWVMHHTSFTFRYAHLYYGTDINNTKGGLLFQEDRAPDYLDFAYFSFVLGMTFQVSDVAVTSRHIRHVVLLHSVLSFAFNTIIIAVTLNIIIH